jgi:hypothetical protein
MARNLTERAVSLAVVAVLVLLVPRAGEAQPGGQVKIIAVLLTVRHRAGPTGAFVKSAVGALLPAGSRVQTGPRSKCALRFPDGAVIRVDENSDLIIQSVAGTSTQLSRGRLWAKVIAGTTARVQGASGVAVVKGTEWTFDGSTVTCYKGAVAYERAGGSTDVPAGFAGTAVQGNQVTLKPAPGRYYPGGDLIQWFGGLRSGEDVGSTPGSSAGLDRKEADLPLDQVIEGAIGALGGLNVIIEGGPDSAQAGRQRWGGATTRAWGGFPGVNSNNLAPTFAGALAGGTLTITDPRAEGQTGPLGKQYFFGPYTPMDAFGYVADGGSAFGLRVRPHVVAGPWYFEGGATGHLSTWAGDGADVTELFAKVRQSWGEVTVGRQRFLEGPVNNTRLGSVLSFETGDAVRCQTRLEHFTFDAAYVEKMNPVLGAPSKGWYGRVTYPVAGGTIAANLVSHQEADLGWSLDLALPVRRGYLDAYGEVGRDAWGRNLSTVGLYVPWVYRQAKADLFLEFAQRDELPSLATLRLYKRIGDHVTAVLSLDKQHGEDLGFGAGVIWRFGG